MKKLTILFAVFLTAPVLADETEEMDGERCITTSRIDKTHILDDQRILFYMRGKEVYLNQLPRKCPGLARPGATFGYETRTSRLCNLDSITILDRAGSGLMRGATCGLGTFVPIDEETADVMRNPELATPEAEDLPTAEPEEVGGNES